MATGTAGTDARAHHLQMVHYFRKAIAYNTTGIGTDATVLVGTLPAGAIVLWTMVKVTTAFNAAGNNVIDVGTSSNDDEYVDGGTTGAGDGDCSPGTTGAYIVWRGADSVASASADTPVYVTYTQSSTAATTGAAYIIMAYVPNNDQ